MAPAKQQILKDAEAFIENCITNAGLELTLKESLPPEDAIEYLVNLCQKHAFNEVDLAVMLCDIRYKYWLHLCYMPDGSTQDVSETDQALGIGKRLVSDSFLAKYDQLLTIAFKAAVATEGFRAFPKYGTAGAACAEYAKSEENLEHAGQDLTDSIEDAKEQPSDKPIVPLGLHKMAAKLVQIHHAKYGIGDMILRLSENENFTILMACGADIFKAMDSSATSYIQRKRVWLIAFILSVVSFFTTYWVLLGLLVCFGIDRSLAKQQNQGEMFQVSYLLALEMLAQNFSGWGTEYPTEQARAIKILGDNVAARWLDYYLPNREEMSLEAIYNVGPNSGLWNS